MFNPDEILLDRVRTVTYSDYKTNELLFRLTSVEDPKVSTSTEGEEILDAQGSSITTLYRAKKGVFTCTNTLISTGVLAVQMGTEKKVASTTSKIQMPTDEILEVNGGKVTLTYKPIDDVKYIYALVDNGIAKSYKQGATVSATEFTIDANGEITVPTGVTGQIYVEYIREIDNGIKIDNDTDKFPKVGRLRVNAIFKDKCTEEVIAGVIISHRAKIDPSQIELALTSTGKHPVTINMMKDYCSTDTNLFSIILAQ